MKYNVTDMKQSESKHQRIVENNTPTKTTRQRGYGFGVTFSGRSFSWQRTFSYPVTHFGFSEASPC
jgi:hypothetical protein